MKFRIPFLLVLILCTGWAVSQDEPAADVPSVASNQLLPTATEEPVKLQVEYLGRVKVPESLIQRIFRETVREVASQLNPQNPPHILARVTLRLGAPGFTIETVEGKERRTVMNMQTWDELAFARMVARAARNGLFSDQELDKHARAGLSRARAVTSVRELQHR